MTGIRKYEYQKFDRLVGWHLGDTGTQVCLMCVPQKPQDGYAIFLGDPDWGYGSVPVCNLCRKEIVTI